MCLIAFFHAPGARYPLVIAANRDEAYARPAAPAAFWPDAGQVLAGRDLSGGGAWLGITRSGRWAALTNYRQAGAHRADAPSRGHLVADFLRGPASPRAYLDAVAASAAHYNGFNLLVGDGTEVRYLSNREGAPRRVETGVHGLSNHLLDTPWPKVLRSTARLAGALDEDRDTVVAALFDALADPAPAVATELPDTGVGIPREKQLSPPFIAADAYGTRASTVIVLDADGRVYFCERRFGPLGRPDGSTRFEFVLQTDDAGALP